MQRRSWTVSFSIGVLTYQTGNVSADELVKQADDLMYSVKKNSKNAIVYAVYLAKTK
jgi:PleD family two-component response regulator